MARDVKPTLPKDNPYIVRVDDPPVAIYEDLPPGETRKPNVIYVRPRMSAAVADKISATRQVTSTLLANIVKWEGPHLDELPLTAETIDQLDVSNNLHLQKVMQRIGAGNVRQESPIPNSATENT